MDPIGLVPTHLTSAVPPAERATFSRAWVCVGRVEDLVRPGAWLRAPVGSEAGVLVVRGTDGVLRAFHAVCPHRGSSLPIGEAGEAEKIRCPYHGFTFELDGRACARTDDLAAVRVSERLGFVFVTLDEAAPPLDEAFGTVPPWFERADLSRLVRARRVAYDVGAAFPLVVENFQESLHFAAVHPALEALTPSSRAETWMPPAGGPWLGGIMPIADGAETVSVSGERNGRPLLVPEADARLVHDALRFPNLLTSLQPDYLLTFTLFPVAADRTRVVACTYVHEDAPEGSYEDVFAFWSRVYEEDRIACERQQHASSSPARRLPRYTEVEEGAAAFDRLAADASRGKPFCGIWGRPFVDLSPFIDTTAFAELDREILMGLSKVESSYTGGTLKWMGVCAPWVDREAGFPDAMRVIRGLSREDFLDFLALGDEDASAFDPDPAARDGYTFGDETDHPFTRAQMLWLERRCGAYFPWKVCYHLLENDRWEDKHSGEGKDFSEEARRVFPTTVAFIESLPMTEMGRVVLFGLTPGDHAPLHRDSEPGKALAIAQSISFEPGRARGEAAADPKGFYLASPDGAREVVVDAPIYWFNDMDWHGVKPEPTFRYSIRCDGVFEPAFLEEIRRALGARTRRA